MEVHKKNLDCVAITDKSGYELGEAVLCPV